MRHKIPFLPVIAAAALAALGHPSLAQEPSTPVEQVQLFAPPAESPAMRVSYSGQPGSETYCYWVVANYTAGASSTGNPVCVTGAAALGPVTGLPTNQVTVTWSRPAGSVSFDLIRLGNTALGASCASCLLLNNTAAAVFTDDGTVVPGAFSSAGVVSRVNAVLSLDNTSSAAGPFVNMRLVNTSYRVPLVGAFTAGSPVEFDARGNLIDGTGGGTVTGGANIGGAQGWFSGLVGSTLQFFTFADGSESAFDIALAANVVTIDPDYTVLEGVGEDTTFSGAKDFTAATMRIPNASGVPGAPDCSSSTVGRVYIDSDDGGLNYNCVQRGAAVYVWEAAANPCSGQQILETANYNGSSSRPMTMNYPTTGSVAGAQPNGSHVISFTSLGEGDVMVGAMFVPSCFTSETFTVDMARREPSATGSGNITLESGCVADGESAIPTYNTGQNTAFSAGTAGNLDLMSLASLTMTGCAANEVLFIRVTHAVGGTYSVDAQMGVMRVRWE